MKIIFLDFDGVLNSTEYFNTTIKENDSEKTLTNLSTLYELFDPVAVKRLNSIIAQTGAKIVISSTWREKYTVDQLREMLKATGLIGEVIDQTPTTGETESGILTGYGRRYEQIQAWLNHNCEVDSFVILDDISNFAHLNSYLINTTWKFGLQDKDIEEAVNLLNK